MDEMARELILDREVQSYVKRGFRVVSRTPTTAQLVKPKRFGCLMLLVSLVTLGLGLLMYLRAQDATIYLSVDTMGKVHRA